MATMSRSKALRTASVVLSAALATGCAVSGLGDGQPGDTPEVARPALPPDRAAAGRRPAPRYDVASWYGAWHHGRPTASGEPFDMEDLTAAHRSLPLGACIEVIHLVNGRHVFVRVNDRGPYVDGRTLDLSYRAAQELAMLDDGLARVRIRRARADACAANEILTN